MAVSRKTHKVILKRKGTRKNRYKLHKKYTKKSMRGGGLEEMFYGVSLNLNKLKENYDVIVTNTGIKLKLKPGVDTSLPTEFYAKSSGISAKDGSYYIGVAKKDFDKIAKDPEDIKKWKNERTIKISDRIIAMTPFVASAHLMSAYKQFNNLDPKYEGNIGIRAANKLATFINTVYRGAYGGVIKLPIDVLSAANKLFRRNPTSEERQELLANPENLEAYNTASQGLPLDDHYIELDEAHQSEPHQSEPHQSEPHPSEPHPSEPHPSEPHQSEPNL
jgi:hypothetical protein